MTLFSQHYHHWIVDFPLYILLSIPCYIPYDDIFPLDIQYISHYKTHLKYHLYPVKWISWGWTETSDLAKGGRQPPQTRSWLVVEPVNPSRWYPNHWYLGLFWGILPKWFIGKMTNGSTQFQMVINDILINGLVLGNIHRKTPHVMGKSMASCRFYLKQIHWL